MQKCPSFKVTTEIATTLCYCYDFYKIIDTFKEKFLEIQPLQTLRSMLISLTSRAGSCLKLQISRVAQAYLFSPPSYVRMYVYMNACIYVSTYVCMSVCIYGYIDIYIYVRTYVCMYVCMYVCSGYFCLRSNVVRSTDVSFRQFLALTWKHSWKSFHLNRTETVLYKKTLHCLLDLQISPICV
jgi:hypothetical protein